MHKLATAFLVHKNLSCLRGITWIFLSCRLLTKWSNLRYFVSHFVSIPSFFLSIFYLVPRLKLLRVDLLPSLLLIWLQKRNSYFSYRIYFLQSVNLWFSVLLATASTVCRMLIICYHSRICVSQSSLVSATSCRHLAFWSLSSRVPTSRVSISSSKSQKHDKPANGRFRISQKFVIVNPRERSVLLHCLHTTAMAVALWRCEVSCQERLSESLFFLHCCLTPFCWARPH